jgi:hypothetical protein
MSASSVKKFVKKQQRESREQLDELASDTFNEIRSIFSSLPGSVSGLTGPEAVRRYYETASQYFKDAYGRGREDVYGFNPRGIAESTSVMKGIIDPALDQYSLMNRGNFMSQALNPSVTEVDPSKIFGSLDYSTKGYSTANPLTNYLDEASQAMIRGPKEVIEEQSAFYASNPNVKGLMTYNV